MDFRILGPLEVSDGDRRVSLGGPRQRALLALLLLHAGEVVHSDRLLHELWGGDRAELKALHVAISRLRRALGPAVLVTRAGGYELCVEPEQLDLRRFERGVARGRASLAAGDAATAAHHLHGALELWGQPLADLADEPFARDEIARLEDAHVAALEDRVAADLALGRHAALTGELERLAAQHPYRERLTEARMLALYRSGRQADALAVFRDCRRVLVEELGIEPGRALRELERRVLEQDPALDLPSEPGLVADERLIGRTRELARLRPVMDDALAGAGATVLIGGEPGIGKSRFAQELAAHARRAGVQVALGRCWEAGGAPSYWPWTQALREIAVDDAVRALSPPVRAQLGALLPELGGSAPPDDPGARFRLFDAVGALLSAAAARQPLALVLDDLHAADPASLLLLRVLAGRAAGMPVLLVGCFRDTEVGPELEQALADLSRQPRVHRVDLAGLSGPDTARVLRQTMGRAPSEELAARVHAETAGNPLFAVELGRLLAARDGDAGEGLPIPAVVGEAIGQRLQRQSRACRDVLALASVAGREFRLDTLERVGGIVETDLDAAIDEAVAARLVAELPGSGDTLRFSHILVRDALYERLPAAQRRRLHRRIAETLEVAHAADPEPHLAEIAHHYLHAGAHAAGKAVDFAARAGDRAAAQHGYEQAARHYDSALRVLEATPAGDPRRTCELLLALGDVLSRAGDEPGAKDALRRAARMASEHGWPEEHARAAIRYGGRFGWARASTDPHLVPLLESGLAAVGDADGPARVALLARLAAARRDDRGRARRVALAEEAVATARRIGDPQTLAFALLGHQVATEGPHTAMHDHVDELIALAERLDDRELLFLAREFTLQRFWRSADREGVEVEVDALERLAGELGQPAQRWHVGASRTMLALMEGRLERAEELIEETVAIGRRAMAWNAIVSERVARFLLRRAQGRLAEVEPDLRRSVHEYPALLRFRCALAHLHAELGQEREARAALRELLRGDLADEHVDAEWVFAVSLLADACATLGDEAAAAKVYALLVPHAALYAHAPIEGTAGAVARALGVLATTLGRFEDAEHHFVAAIATERRMRAAPWVAHAQHGLADMLLERRREGDAARATELLASARATYRMCTMVRWAERAARG